MFFRMRLRPWCSFSGMLFSFLEDFLSSVFADLIREVTMSWNPTENRKEMMKNTESLCTMWKKI